jgi:hypothetical protein
MPFQMLVEMKFQTWIKKSLRVSLALELWKLYVPPFSQSGQSQSICDGRLESRGFA